MKSPSRLSCQGQSLGRWMTSRLADLARRPGTAISCLRMVAVVALVWKTDAMAPAARVRLNAIAANTSQAELAAKDPSVKCARAPDLRTRKEPRALTLEERIRLFTALDTDDVALKADVPDLARFMLATGQRIGECLGVLWMEVDLVGCRVEVSSTVIRWTGHGLVRKSTKSRAGQRILLLPSWAVADLQRRRARGVRLDAPVFPNTCGGWRDPKNTRRDFRTALDRADFRWVTSHNFRKTTATLLDQAGLSARVIDGRACPSG